MYSYKIKSHPDVSLLQHLKNVGDRCQEIIKNKDIKFSYSKEMLIFAAKVMGYTHDLGKANLYFQNYLRDMETKGESNEDRTLRSHAQLSALFTYLQLKDFDNKLAVMAFIIVKKHHGDLDDFGSECIFEDREVKKQKDIVKSQLYSIDKNEFRTIIEELFLKQFNDNAIIDALDDVQDEEDNLMDDLIENENYEEYILYKFLFSVLIYADKEDAIFKGKNNITYDIPANIVDEYKSIKFKDVNSFLAKTRNEIYDDVINSMNNPINRIMSITVPTGTGKTLTAISAALRLREKIKDSMKIIYCLPFTSVIDQNYDVYKDVIKTILGEEKATNDRILKHHHLAGLKYVGEYNNFEDNRGKFLTENWNSQIIVTTFMQFFNSVFSNKNSELIKYNNISNSIVLLDEIQSLPYCYWHVINVLFKIMAEKLNIFFILITATQPLIFEKKEIKELAEGNEKYFKEFKRTKLHINLEPIEWNEFVERMEGLISNNSEKNILIILNTVSLAQNMYNEIKKIDIKNTDIYFLSTGIVPKERKKRIEDIRKNKRRKIVISTQLIEAGVDVDMDIVVRDMATLDSINQSAGRCNREYRGDYLGNVYIYNIINDKGREYSKFIYDKFLIDKTKEVLGDRKIINEEEYLYLNNKYFSLVSENMSNDSSHKLMELISNLKFNNVREKFHLIDAQNKVSVFIETDEESRITWNNYEKIRKIKDPFKMREEFSTIKQEFYNNVINVFKNKVKDSEELGIIHIPYEALKGSYNIETGYILKDMDAIL